MQEKLVMKFLVHVEDDDVQLKGGSHYQLVTSGMSMQTIEAMLFSSKNCNGNQISGE